MLERELLPLVVSTLDAAFVAQELPFETVQSYQPTTQGRPPGPIAWLTLLFNQKVGFPARSTLPDPDDDFGTIQRQAQRYNAVFQITGTNYDPKDTATYTAGDVATLTRDLVLSDIFRLPLSAQGVGLEIPSDIRVTNFVNGHDQNEKAPSFDFVLTHEQITLTKTPAAVSTGYRQYPV